MDFRVDFLKVTSPVWPDALQIKVFHKCFKWTIEIITLLHYYNVASNKFPKAFKIAKKTKRD